MNEINITGRLDPQKRPAELVKGSNEQGELQAGKPIAVTPLIGRDAELSLLEDRWDRAQDGMGQVVMVAGDAGLGKSRLIQAITQQAKEDVSSTRGSGAVESGTGSHGQPPFVIEWRCSRHCQNSDLYPVSDFMERLLGFANDQSPADRFDLLARHLEDFNLGQPESVGLFAKLLFLPPGERYLAAGLTPAREREETFSMLLQWLDAHAAKRPVLFVIEDLHWCDASTLEFLGQFIARRPDERILTILTFRREFTIPWSAAAHHTVLSLSRLTRRQVAQWIRRGSHERLPDSLVAQIYERTAGVPLLVEEFTRLVRESAEAARCSEASPSGGATEAEIPATLSDLVVARLDRIASDREIAQFAAALGRQFDYELLAAALSVDEQRLEDELAKLVAANILFAEGQLPHRSYLFKHSLVEEALYNTIEEPKRRQFHRQIAEVMESRLPVMIDLPPELLAEHFLKAGAIQKAVEYRLKAGLRSRDRFANVEAVSHFNKGLELLELLEPSAERDSRELELLGPLGTAYIGWRGYAAPEVGPVFHRAHILCERVGQTPQVFAIMWGNFAFHVVRGDLKICTELAEEAVAFGERLNDPGILMEALFLRGVTRLYRGDFAGTRESCTRALDEFDDRARAAFWAATVGEDAGVTHRCYLALAWWFLGFPERALQLNQEMLELARSVNQPFSLAYALHHTAWLYQLCRLGRRTEEFGQEQMRLATDQGFLFWHASGALYAAGGLLLQGKTEESMQLLQNGVVSYRVTGSEL
ncbi:MAG: AAA family ATPase, partial [Verrucomicrobia bacterium]|nr:AAA family ATPase [Verrucomicrobiota bacterium]